MDIKAEIEKVVAKIAGDGDLKEKFSKDPTGTVKSIVGDKVDKETLDKIIATAKTMIGKVDLGGIGEKISSALGGKLPDAVTGLFGGKKDEEEKKN